MENNLNNREILHLTFHEGSGHILHDASGNLPPVEIQYRFRSPRWISPREPAWRSCGVGGPALLFDGNSTAIVCPPEAVTLQGSVLSCCAWIAPRSFECADPQEAERGDAHLTAVLAQTDPAGRRGLILGYHRFGRLCFQLDTEAGRYTLWASACLRAVQWNHVTAVYDGTAGRISLFLDGESVGCLSVPPGTALLPAEGHSLMIGRQEGARVISAGVLNMFSGLMSGLRILSRALSPSEIASLAAADRPKIPWEEIGPENILAEDPYKTQFHGGPRQHWMNEPHAPLFCRGRYHLFFQSNNIGSYWGNISWGHLVSEDTVHWHQVQDAIVPAESTVALDGVWTGGATLDQNGMPVLFFTAADLAYASHGLHSNQNIGAAWPADPSDPELKDWILLDHLAIAQQPGMGRLGEFRDPHVWREADGWYMVVCGGSLKTEGGAALLFRTERLEVTPSGGLEMDWQYLGPAFEMENPAPVYGSSWELPVLLPLTNRAGTVRKYVLFLMPAPPDRADNKVYYYIGTCRLPDQLFVPDPDFGPRPRLMDYGDNIFTGPSVLRDPATGQVCLFSIMQDKRAPAEEAEAGWAHCVGLTRNLWLNDGGTDLCVTPDPRLDLLRDRELLALDHSSLEEANRALEGLREDLYCLRAEVEPEEAFTLTFQADADGTGSVFRYEPRTGILSGRPGWPGTFGSAVPMEGPLPLRGKTLTMEIFVDRSLTEGFFNGEKALSLRSYGPADARRVFFSCPGTLRIRTLNLWRLRRI